MSTIKDSIDKGYLCLARLGGSVTNQTLLEMAIGDTLPGVARNKIPAGNGGD